MSQHQERLPALGQPVEAPVPEGDNDFAGEHDSTTVDDEVMVDGGTGESERPGGWSGLDRDGPP